MPYLGHFPKEKCRRADQWNTSYENLRGTPKTSIPYFNLVGTLLQTLQIGHHVGDIFRANIQTGRGGHEGIM